MGQTQYRGSCLCGAVSFKVDAELAAPDACHCTRCRKLSGHFWSSTDVRRTAVRIHGADELKWFHTSDKVRRGFCSTCGSSLFWDPVDRDFLAIAMGAFDSPTHTKVKMHIHVADKGDYYELRDGLPQNQH